METAYNPSLEEVFEREKKDLLETGISLTSFEVSTQRGMVATIIDPEIMKGRDKYDAIKKIGKRFRDDGYSIDNVTFIMTGRNMQDHSQKVLLVCRKYVVTGNIQIIQEIFKVVKGNIEFVPNSRYLTDKAESYIIDQFMSGYENKKWE